MGLVRGHLKALSGTYASVRLLGVPALNPCPSAPTLAENGEVKCQGPNLNYFIQASSRPFTCFPGLSTLRQARYLELGKPNMSAGSPAPASGELGVLAALLPLFSSASSMVPCWE